MAYRFWFFCLFGFLNWTTVFCQDQTDLFSSDEAKAFRVRNENVVSNVSYGNFDVYFSRCDWNVDPAVDFISGSVTAYFKSLSNNQDKIIFDCSDSLVIDSVMRGSFHFNFLHNTDLCEILFPVNLQTGDVDSVQIFYHGQPAETGNGSFISAMHDNQPVIWTLSEPYGARDWWPCRQNCADKIDSMEINCRIPLGNRCGSNGKLISIDTISSDVVYHWKTNYPIAPYLVAIGVTNYSDVSTSIILSSNDTLPITNFIYPENVAAATDGIDATGDLILFFDSLLTPYPFKQEKYGHTEFGWGGGMEHQTMTFLGTFGFEIVAHELAHQWFGDATTCESWKDIWLHEGFATFLSGIAINRFDPESFHAFKYAALKSIVSLPDGSVICDDTTSVSRIFNSRLSYKKASYVLYMLNWLMGDSAFYEGLKIYLSDINQKYSYGTTADLQSALEQSGGNSLSVFFDEWVVKEGYPSFDVRWTGGTKNLTVTIDQSTSNSSVPYFHVPVELQFSDHHHDTLILFQPAFSGQQFSLSLNFIPENVVIDPELKIISGDNRVTMISPPGSIDEKIELYPNPVIAELSLFSKLSQTNPLSFELSDGAGKIVLRKTLGGSAHETVNLQGLSSGVYIAKIGTSEGNIFKKVVIE